MKGGARRSGFLESGFPAPAFWGFVVVGCFVVTIGFVLESFHGHGFAKVDAIVPRDEDIGRPNGLVGVAF